MTINLKPTKLCVNILNELQQNYSDELIFDSIRVRVSKEFISNIDTLKEEIKVNAIFYEETSVMIMVFKEFKEEINSISSFKNLINKYYKMVESKLVKSGIYSALIIFDFYIKNQVEDIETAI